MVAATQWFVSFVRAQPFSRPLGIAIARVFALLGLLMVSAIPYRSFKELDLAPRSYRPWSPSWSS